jgi:hypothetical protein
MFGTDEYFEVCYTENGKYKGIALFGNRVDAEEYIAWQEMKEDQCASCWKEHQAFIYQDHR